MSRGKQAHADRQEGNRAPPPGAAERLPPDPLAVTPAAQTGRRAATADADCLRPSELQALQPLVGNRAVQRALRQRRSPARPRPPSPPIHITGGLAPSAVTRAFGPDRTLTAVVTISYDPVTNQVRMVGAGDEAYLREHTPGGNPTLDRGDVEEGGYLTADVAGLDMEAQREIARVLGVDRRVLTGTRAAPPEPTEEAAAGTPDAPLAPGGEWNGETILNRLTQIDQFRDTLFDQFRCGPTSALAVHIMGGWDALRNVAESIRPRVNQIRAIDSDETIRSAATTYLRGLQAFTGGTMATATYRHLSLLADALFLVVRYDRILEIIRTGEDAAIGTRSEELGAVSGMGHEQVSTAWPQFTTWLSAQFGGERRAHGGEAIPRLPPRGERLGMRDLRQLVGQLVGFRLVSLIIAVPYGTQPAPSGRGETIEEGTLTHYIALLVDGEGQALVYDPYPRGGSQVIRVRGNQRLLEPYFMGRWRVDGRLAAASSEAEGPESGVIDVDGGT